MKFRLSVRDQMNGLRTPYKCGLPRFRFSTCASEFTSYNAPTIKLNFNLPKNRSSLRGKHVVGIPSK
jgi:hypothetical protein